MPRSKATSTQSNERPSGEATERVVFCATQDALDLAGLLIQAPGARQKAAALCIWVHTRQQNFAEPEYVGIGRLMVSLGHDFLSVNTRGHDFGSWYRTADGPVLFGSAWERFSDSVYDLDAWVDFAVREGYRQIVLVGHGFGGAKVVHFQAQRNRPEVAAIVLASSGAAVRDKFSEAEADLAARMVAEGRGRDLMPWGTGGDTYTSTVSADWYVSRERMHAELYGTESLPPAIARVRVPVAAWYGARESRKNRDVAAFLDWLEANAVQAPRFHRTLVPGMGFFYRGHEPRVADLLCDALASFGLRAAIAAQ